jgi:hypothetical protein
VAAMTAKTIDPSRAAELQLLAQAPPSARTAAFDITYACVYGCGTSATIDDTLTSTPFPRSRIGGSAARAVDRRTP